MESNSRHSNVGRDRPEEGTVPISRMDGAKKEDETGTALSASETCPRGSALPAKENETQLPSTLVQQTERRLLK